MKKVYLFLAALMVSAASFAQLNVQIYDNFGNDITNGSMMITGVHNGSDTDVKFKLKNTGATSLDVKVRRENVQGYTNSICFAEFCFDSALAVTPMSQTLLPGAVDSSFHGLFYTASANNIGDICATYKIFNANDESQFVSVRVYYGNCLTASVAENASDAVSVSAYPNPASGSVLIKYNLNAEGQLLISDITGKQVKSIRLNSGSQSAQVDISDLKSGIYIYSIQSGTKKIISKKLVVR